MRAAHFSEERYVAAAIFAESKAFAQIDLLRMQTVANDIVQEILGRLRRKLKRKRNDYSLLDSENRKICKPLVECLEQRWSRFGMQDCSRMRVKCNGRRHCTNSSSTVDDVTHYPLMPEMQAVKYAERKDGRPRDVSVFGAMKYLHSL